MEFKSLEQHLPIINKFLDVPINFDELQEFIATNLPVRIVNAKGVNDIGNAGEVTYYIDDEGNYTLEIFYPDSDDLDAEAVAVEEVLHLIHALINPAFENNSIARYELHTELERQGLETLTAKTLNSVRPEFLAQMREKLTEAELLIGLENMNINKSQLALSFLKGETKDLGFRIGIEEINNITKFLIKNGVIRAESATLVRLNELRKEKSKLIMQQHTLAQNDDDSLLKIQELTRRIQNLNTRIQDFFKKQTLLITDAIKEMSGFYELLGLYGLVELYRYRKITEKVTLMEKEDLMGVVQQVLNSRKSRLIEVIHYELRPVGYYSNSKLSTGEWLDVTQDDKRAKLVKAKLGDVSKDKLALVVLKIIDGILFESWLSSLGQGILEASELFWDLSADQQHLKLNPEYDRLNREAIREAIEMGGIIVPHIISNAEEATISSLLLAAKDAPWPEEDLFLTAAFAELAYKSVRSADTPAFINSSVWSRNIYSTIKYISRALATGKFDNAEKVIEMTITLSKLYYQVEAESQRLSILTEVLVKSIRSYMTNTSESLVDLSGRSDYPLGLTITNDATFNRSTNSVSIWQDLMDAIDNFLERSNRPSEVVLELMRAGSVQEIAEMVGFEN